MLIAEARGMLLTPVIFRYASVASTLNPPPITIGVPKSDRLVTKLIKKCRN
jgi:hypothetical protein